MKQLVFLFLVVTSAFAQPRFHDPFSPTDTR